MRTIQVRVISNSKKNEINEEKELFRIRVTAPAQAGKANKAATEAIAKHFGLRKNCVQLIKGAKSRDKVFQIK